MKEYAYIPIAKAAQVADPDSYAVRVLLQVFKPTGLYDTYGEEMMEAANYLCLESDANGFTQAQQDDIAALGGEHGELDTFRDTLLPAHIAAIPSQIEPLP